MRHLLLLTAIFVASCGSIEKSQESTQELDKNLLAGIGDVVLKIERERDLENAFGKADIFGRTTKEGHTEIRFAGVESDGTVVLYRKDIDVLTNETTMSRTPISSTTGSTETNVTGTGTTRGNTTSVRGQARSSTTSTTVSSADDYHIAVPSDTMAIRLGPSERRLPVSGFVIEIRNATRNSLEYRVYQQ